MSLKALGDYITVSKYAHFNEAEGRREKWAESVDRMFSMHRKKFSGNQRVIDILPVLQEAVTSKKILGSMRAVQFGQVGLLGRGQDQKLYNCCYSYCDRTEFFEELMLNLLYGSGCGFGVQFCHIDKLPDLRKPTLCGLGERFTVPDTVEGWARAIGVLVESYLIEGKNAVRFDFSKIRKKGAAISSGVGTAPGPVGLITAIMRVRNVLERCLKDGQTRLRPIDCYDVAMHSSDAVLSGGVRRSATICIFSPEDEDMLGAKTGNWSKENPQRARSNNSAALIRGKHDKAAFNRITSRVKEWGEPGFVWLESDYHGVNPCVEVCFYPQINGVSGWQFCNLATINMSIVKTVAEFHRACELASILCTLQADYTDFRHLPEATRLITEREALIGVSMTGMSQNPRIAFNADALRAGARIVKDTNKLWSVVTDINQAARTTCIKPEGTTSAALGTSSGIGPWHSKRGLRRVTGNTGEPLLDALREANPLMFEKGTYGADWCASFPYAVEENSVFKKDLSAQGALEKILLVKRNWVDAGRNEKLSADKGLSNNVSNTISVGPNEWDAAFEFIWDNQNDLTGISLLSSSGDLDYTQAPFVEVLDEAEMLAQFGSDTCELAELHIIECEGKLSHPPKSNIESCAHRLQLLRQYRKIRRNWKDIDFSNVKEENGDQIEIGESIACGSGGCELL